MTPHLENELFLLKKAIEAMPFTFPDAQKARYLDKLKEFEASPETDRKEIEEAIVEVGKASWPYRKAYEEMFKNYASEKYEQYFIDKLSEPTRKKYMEFKKRGGSISDFRRGRDFEEAFTPEENLVIEEAVFAARDGLKDYMREVIREKSGEYEEALNIYQQKKHDLENMLQSLKDMAAKSEKWAPEILDKVSGLEEGWSAVERDFDEDKLRHEIEYWQGVLGLEEIE